MSQNLKISDDELATATGNLVNSKLTVAQVQDIVSFFRIFLAELASNYSIQSTLEGLEDDTDNKTCAKLLACLTRWNDLQFDNGGFAPTNANRTGFNASIDVEEFKIFRYGWTLLWDLPSNLVSLNGNRRRTTQQGSFKLIGYPRFS